MDKPEHIQQILKSIPSNPGIYQYYDVNGTIIYVGKAKNLKKRVYSYFNKEKSLNAKTQILVRKINDIKYIVVDTEIDALLLENNLIKKYQPKYNIQLKDDKTYPWICIKNEPFPRVFSTRTVLKDGSHYFGPFASIKIMNTLLDLIKKLYKLRNCNFKLTEENINKGKFKVCLEYHIGNCKGGCVGKETNTDYDQKILEIKNIVKGNIGSVTKHLKDLLQEHVKELDFEKAEMIQAKIILLEKFQSRSTIVSPTVNNVDVFSIVSDQKAGYVNFLKVMNGGIVQGHTIELVKKLEETDEELLTHAITEIRERFNSTSKEVIIPFKIDVKFPDIEFVVPKIGDKKHLLDLSRRNADYYRRDKMKQELLVDPERHSKRIMAQMKTDLRMHVEPKHIECFDNSNFQGSFPVAAMVLFRNGKPSKREYRHYNIKTVEGPDDFASMAEIIYRRYKRLLDEKQALPQLIIVDGGKGQLSAAVSSLEKLKLRGQISIIGIAKRLEEIYFPNDSIPLYLDKRSESLKIIQQARDEAHRFGITHHRKKRDKATLKTELTEIKGISDITSQKLLSHFKSVKKIKVSSVKELEVVVGLDKAQKVFLFYNK